MTAIGTRPAFLMAPALAWLIGLMVVPCGLVLALAFFQRGIYGGVDYTFTLENFARVFDPLYAGIFLNSARIAGIATLIAVIIGYAAAYAIASCRRSLAAGAAVLRGAALLVELSHPHLCLDRAAQPRGAGHAVAALVRL